MTKTINISLTLESIDKAIAELQAYKRRVEDRKKTFIKRLKDEGLIDLNVRWAGTLYDGIDATQTRADDVENGFVISASGQAVCFIEFGTGVHYNSFRAYPGKTPEGMAGIGQYGYGYGNNDYWFFTGNAAYCTAGGVQADGHPNTVMTQGNPANCHMYNTTKWIKDNAVRIAKEVFAQ